MLYFMLPSTHHMLESGPVFPGKVRPVSRIIRGPRSGSDSTRFEPPVYWRKPVKNHMKQFRVLAVLLVMRS